MSKLDHSYAERHHTTNTTLSRTTSCAALLIGACALQVLAQGPTLTMVPSLNNGYNISCFGFKDGAIDLTVTGGTAPYTYAWSHGPTTQDVANLPAGFYAVTVRDAAALASRAEITLTEPVELRAEMTPFEYGNGYNISLFNAYNGSIELLAEGGVPPYSYDWRDGPTTQNRTALGSDNYDVGVTDANGCIHRTDPIYLRQPDRSDWTMNGNAGTNPATNYIGSSDNKDVVFRSNGAERLRLKGDGDVKVNSLAATGNKLIYADENGILKRANWGQDLQMSDIPWFLGGNNNVTSTTNRIGPINEMDFSFIANNVERMRITADGKVGIGENVLVTENGQVGIGTTTALGGSLNIKRDQGDWLQLKRKAQDGTDAGAWALHNGDPSQNHLAFHYYMPGGGALLNRLTLWNDGKVSIGEKVMVTENGNVGIGTTTTLDAPLSVKQGQGDWIKLKRTAQDGTDDGAWAIHNGNGNQNQLAFHFYPATGEPLWNRLVLWNDGKVSIGNTTPGISPLYKLYVEGGVVCRDVKVTATNFPDYVFANNYPLMPLEDLAHYLHQNGHLPTMPPASEVEANEGVEIGDLQLRLLKTVEEQQLYILQLHAELQVLKTRLNALEYNQR